MIFRKKRVFFAILSVCFFILIIEIVSRVEWSFRKDVPFFSPNTYFYYPELRNVERKNLTKEDKSFDILLLGGSAFHEKWGNISRLLLEKMTYATKGRIRVHNLSKAGHTSLDSYYKYRRLSNKKFDLILFYHGINDLRLNNCPSSIYQSDYSHSTWYKVINLFERHGKISNIALLYSLYYRITKMEEKLSSPPKYLSSKQQKQEWMKYGNTIKSAKSFRNNLKRILDIATEKQENVIIMTFCFYVPKDYSPERFENGTLDYNLHDSPIEIWGIPKNIIAGITAQNEIIKDFAGRSDIVTFIDQNSLLPKNGLYFNDICHLTQKGCEKFVDNIMNRILDPDKPTTIGIHPHNGLSMAREKGIMQWMLLP